MLLTITTTHQPATDLGYLLHKHPARSQSFDLPVGQAHVFYPEATADRCTAALLLDIDPIGLVRKSRRSEFALANYVKDRPYVASSFMSSAIVKVYRSAINGQCKTHPELADTHIPLEAKLAVVHSPGGTETFHNLFEPLGYQVEAEGHALDAQFEDWGQSRYFTLALSGTVRLSDLLTHLYVLIPTLDSDKHYYIGPDEVEKLLSRGEGWLPDHPERNWITRRYLNRRRGLVSEAMARLAEGAEDSEEGEESADKEEEAVEQPLSLHQQRMDAVMTTLKATRAERVLDLGCDEGKLLRLLLEDKQFREIVGVDVSHWVLQKAARRLKFDRMPPSSVSALL